MRIFEIYDSKAEAFLKPFFSMTRMTALRSFEQAVRDESSDFHKFASDYTLFEIGEWSEQDGDLVPLKAKVALGCAIEFLKEKTPELTAVRGDC